MRRKHKFLSLCAALCIVMVSCAEQPVEKTVVTITNAQLMPYTEAFLESVLPDVDLQQELLISNSLNYQVRRRLRAGHGSDLIVSTQPSSRTTYSYALPLSGYTFSAAYENTMINSLSTQGTLYYLPLPGQYYGYIVNKTMFDEAGIALPKNNTELLSALEWFSENRIGCSKTGQVFGFREQEYTAIGNYLVGYMVPDFLATPQGVAWLDAFEKKEASLEGNWEPMYDFLRQVIDKNLMDVSFYIKHGNVPVNNIHMSKGNLVAVYGYSSFLEECIEANAQAAAAGQCPLYEYTILPFMGNDDNSANWTIMMPAAYIGINKAVQQDAEKLDACCRILEALSTQEGQEALMQDTHTEHSYLKSYERTFTDNKALPVGLQDVVENGYVYNIDFPSRVIEYLGQQTTYFLGGKKEAAECLRAVDDYYIRGISSDEQPHELIGQVSQDFIYYNYDTRLKETILGDLVADSVAAYAQVPIALVNGGTIRASIYKGEVYEADLQMVCPYPNQIIVVELTGEVLYQMFENSLTRVKDYELLPGGRFLQVSGIHYTYDSTQPAGQRLIALTLPDGTPIEPAQRYTVAINDYMAGISGYLDGNGDGYTMLNLYSQDDPKATQVTLVKEQLGTYCDALKNHIAKQLPAATKTEKRITDIAEQQRIVTP